MKMYKTDLHIHTCLSPCADLDMSPKYIIKEAEKKGIDIVGICDHNSCENVPAVGRHAENQGGDVNVIGGLEITSNEEVHILALFADEERLFSMQKIVYDNLQGINNEKRFGEQVVVNENDEVMGFNKKLLIGTTELSIEDIVNLIHELDGLAIASHIDRETYSIIHQLGFIPQRIQLDAVEVSTPNKIKDFKDISLPVITSSDAHAIKHIGRSFTWFFMEEPNLEEIRKSLLGKDGRKVMV
ncbi:MAG: PHP domain-containing protein [Candidatus Aminicenantes bacterium]|nr:PHP domain-containing protein [Candidatus Aminicenantes bacterium]NIM80677.1 PHP domain-containing protein [Candidatus Aminicenantes bacterium]NIN20054.1 PHP domain-containing protein [Candidatus Aminicenantes bacterium]NIN43841.1 PHP domain-containing protein [Candidatus Aminicenantes bacterium]NIN86652.1 PHP domain-containing protein [Candidatus Aminicenantes bacterium]